MKKVVLDTNFFLMPYSEGIDVFSEVERLIRDEYEIVTFTGVISELKKISEGRRTTGKDKTAARIGLQLLEKKGVKVIDGTDNVDFDIAFYAEKNPGSAVVCTNDRELRKKLKKLETPVVGMRNRRYLDFV